MTKLQQIGGVLDIPKATAHKPYRVWRAMLQRTHPEVFESNKPTYTDTTVHPDWYIYSKFLEWYELNNPNGNLMVDKDLHMLNEYGPQSCVCVTHKFNCAITQGYSRKSLPIGVSSTGSKYRGRLRKHGVDIQSPSLATPESAQDWYLREKVAYIRSLYPHEPNRAIPALAETFIEGTFNP